MCQVPVPDSLWKLGWTPLCITVTSHDNHGIPDHWPFECLLNTLPRMISKKHQSSAWGTNRSLGWYQRNIKALHYWPFVRGIHWWPVDSPHKGPVMQKNVPMSWRHHGNPVPLSMMCDFKFLASVITFDSVLCLLPTIVIRVKKSLIKWPPWQLLYSILIQMSLKFVSRV